MSAFLQSAIRTPQSAIESLVDRLLASPRYGEHWARMWLDVVRYSDSNGFDWDEFRPQAWRFRDYVIRSFNADKPFDRFVREQLAGDELLAGPPRDAAEQDGLIATGYLRLGPHDNSAAQFGEDKTSRASSSWPISSRRPAPRSSASRCRAAAATITSSIRSRRPITTGCARSSRA